MTDEADARAVVGDVVARARAAQAIADRWTQAEADEAAVAAGWAIIEPARNRALAELAVRDTGLGNVADKIAKNQRKTIGLLRDLQGARSVGVIAEDADARHRRDRAAGRRRRRDHAVDQSRRDAGEQDHQRAEGPQRGHRRAVAEGPVDAARCCSGSSTRSSTRIGAPRDLVQLLPAPVTRENDARADAAGATSSSRPARRPTCAPRTRAARRRSASAPATSPASSTRRPTSTTPRRRSCARRRSTTRRAARRRTASSSSTRSTTRCSRRSQRAGRRAARRRRRRRRCSARCWPDGKLVAGLSSRRIGGERSLRTRRPDARRRCAAATIPDGRRRRASGREHPFSGEKLSPVLGVLSRAAISPRAARARRAHLRYQGAGHSVGLHTRAQRARASSSA